MCLDRNEICQSIVGKTVLTRICSAAAFGALRLHSFEYLIRKATTCDDEMDVDAERKETVVDDSALIAAAAAGGDDASPAASAALLLELSAAAGQCRISRDVQACAELSLMV